MKSQTSLPRNTLHIPKWFLCRYELRTECKSHANQWMLKESESEISTILHILTLLATTNQNEAYVLLCHI
jgi:hypothetical protein